MRKLFASVVLTCLCSSAFADEPQVINVDKYYQALSVDVMTQFVWGNEVFTVGARIERNGKEYVCKKFKQGFEHVDSETSPASWRNLS